MEIVLKDLQKKLKIDFDLISKKLKKAGVILGLDDNTELSVVLVDNNTIKELNLKYRGIDKETDVLAFALYNSLEEINYMKEKGLKEILLGDVIVNVEMLKENEDNITSLIIHGLLHLLGYDHKDTKQAFIMKEKELKLLQAINNFTTNEK